MTTDYKARLKQARKAFKQADPKNQDEVKRAHAEYRQALQNYLNSRGV